MSATPQQPKLYASHLSIPYTTSSSPLLTLDVHTPTTPPPPSSPSFALIYIHGGAFRDPLVTSLSILPSLSSIFSSPGPAEKEKGKGKGKGKFKGISIVVAASLNYRLSAYPAHSSHPSKPVGDEDRNVIWPTHLDDVIKAIHFLFSPSSPPFSLSSSSSSSSSSSTTTTTGTREAGKKEEEDEEKEKGGIILCGHSVGGTLAVHAAAALLLKAEAAAGSGEGNNNNNNSIPPVRALVSLAGIFNFRKCRDAHRTFSGLYDEFMTAAFGGPEKMGSWAVADLYPEESVNGKRLTIQGEGGGVVGETVVEILKRKGRGLVVVLGYSKEDELVEEEQGERFASVLLQGGGQMDGEGGLRIRHVETKGGHHEIVDQGVEIGRCVGVAVDMLLGEVL